MNQELSTDLKEHYQSGQYATDSGVRIFYVRKGKGEKVLLLPGLLATSYTFRDCMEILSQHYEAISLDWPGTGFSGPPVLSYSHRYLAKVLRDFLDEVAGEEKVHLVCHEYAGPISFLLLNEDPEKVKSLTVVSSFLDLKKARFTFPVRLLRIPLLGYLLSYLFLPPVIQVLNNLFVLSKERPMSLEKAKDYYYLLFSEEKKHFTRKICCYIDRTIHAQRDMESGIKKIVGLRQVLVGSLDPTDDPLQTEYLKEILRLSFVQVLDTGHFPMEEAPLSFSDKIVPFLEFSNRNKSRKATGNHLGNNREN